MITSFTGKYTFLSNFYAVPLIMRDGMTANSVEHAFQAEKRAEAKDRLAILICSTPAQAKRMARSKTMRPDWLQIRDEVMLYYVRMKFRNSILRPMLVATDTLKLIEGNTWGDTYWGAIWTAQGWRGENKLGEILMQVRRECGVMP
jgi:ribA/ribD-fused uncharacterized protein